MLVLGEPRAVPDDDALAAVEVPADDVARARELPEPPKVHELALTECSAARGRFSDQTGAGR